MNTQREKERKMRKSNENRKREKVEESSGAYPLMMRFPYGLKMARETDESWPRKVFFNCPV
jgi:hypothetical protein